MTATPDHPPIRELHPTPRDVSALEVSASHRPGVELVDGDSRPWIYTNMVSSLDGAVARGGVSGGLGNDADAAIFSALRSHCDAIIVGSGTANAERYRPPSTRHAPQRRARGQDTAARLVIVSGRLNLDPNLPVLHPPDDRPPPLVITTAAAAAGERAEALAGRAELVIVAEGPPDAIGGPTLAAGDIARVLAERRLQACLLEGGPTLNALFAAADLIDEWNLTIAPTLIAATDGLRATLGEHAAPAGEFDLSGLWLSDHHLFGRWIRRRH